MEEEEVGLNNELLGDTTSDLPYEEVEVDRANHNNDGQYGWVDIDGKQCTNDYTSNAYGGQYCVGDTYTDPNGGTQTIRNIGFHGLDLAPNQWDAEETYADVGEKLGMSMEEWTEFSDELQALNGDVDALKGNMFGPTEQERGRLGIRISQQNPDWDEAQVMAEVDKLLEEKWMTSDAYAEAAAAETALFEKYGIQKDNPGVYGSGVWIDEDGKYHKFESSSGNMYQTSQDDSLLDYAVPIGIGIGIGVITGGVGGALGTGSLGSTVGGALNSVISSAIGQVAVTGGVDPSALLQAAILGGIGGLADAAVDGKLPPGMDEAVWDVADTLNMEYAQVIDLIEGVATGAVSGASLEEIALGAAGSWTSSQIQDWVQNTLGDEFEVDDWFKDGSSTIPTEALNPLIEGSINAAIAGGMSKEDAVSMAWDYFKAGGDVDFMLPDSPEFKDWLGSLNLPDIDISKDDEWSYTTNEDGSIDITWNLPSVDIGGGDWSIGDLCYDDEGNPGVIGKTGLCDVKLPDIGSIDTPYDCSIKGEGWTWDNLVGDCIPPIGEIPKPACLKGESWDELLGKCMPDIGTPYDCSEKGEGWTWDNLVGDCIPPIGDIPKPNCLAGEEWSELLNKCVDVNFTPVKPDCLAGESWSELDNKCIPDVVECMSGFEWSDLYGKCVKKIDDDVKVDTPDTGCPEGWKDEDGTCVKIEVPDVNVPEVPEFGGGNAAAGHDFKAQGLFDYTNIDVYKGAPIEPWKKALNTAKGMLS